MVQAHQLKEGVMKIEIIELTADRIFKEWILDNPEVKLCTCDLCISDNDSKTDWSSDDGHEPL